MSNCCAPKKDDLHEHGHVHEKKKFDPILHGSLAVVLVTLALYFCGLKNFQPLHHFVHAELELMGQMWWGVLLGVIVVGFMSKIPREYFTALLGRGDTYGGIIRAAVAGLFLDLCSHGILMVGAKLYERGASLAQVMTFLIASPWNSISLTIILISLIGFKWTALYVIASAVIAIATGVVYKTLTDKKILPDNPHKTNLPEGFSLRKDAAAQLKAFRPSKKFFGEVAKGGWEDGQMVIKWLLFGLIIAAAIRAFVPTDIFQDWFGPTLVGLLLTLIATTIIEVCSEGSAPIASELVTRAAAPGNAFAFLMAGVSTDYTEMLVIREFTKSWKIALSLPLITVPQILVLGYLMNQF